MKILTDPRSGSYQGITSSRNRYGQYVRTRAIPIQPRTVRQGEIRGQFGRYTTAWRTASDAQRAAWSNMAANYSVSDSLGQSNPLNGFSFFTSAQLLYALYFGATWGLTAPSALPIFGTDLNTIAITMDDSANSVSVAWTPNGSAVGDNRIVFQSTGPVSPGINSPPGPHYWRDVGSFLDNDTSPQLLSAQYASLFGAIVTGQKIFWRYAEVDGNALRRSSWQSAVVIAIP